MISILMPLKNETLHLNECISSVQEQSVTSFELIIVDDNSTDDSFKKLEVLASNDSRIKLFKNPGNGIIAALQYAESKISGNYVSRQDADDIMPVHKLKELLQILKEQGKKHIATGKVRYFSKTGIQGGFKKYEEWVNSLCENDTHYEQLFKECVLVSSNWMLHTDDFKQLGGFKDSIYPEDYHFVFKLFENNFKIISSDKVTHLWRDHAGRASRTLEQYKDQKFYSLKIQEFKKIYKNRSASLWGAGPTGKKLAKELIKQNVEFHWVTNNENKIGKKIYEIEIHHFESLVNRLNNPLIISVTKRDALDSVFRFLTKIKLFNYHEF